MYRKIFMKSNVRSKRHLEQTRKRTALLPKIAFTLISSLLLSSLANAVCESVAESTPNGELQDNGDGTVIDSTTGLMWKQCSEGQENDAACTGSVSAYSWQEALQILETLNTNGGFAGHSDWRLPNIKELRSIVEVACHTPAINSVRFPNTPATNYWSSTASFDDTENAWRVEFADGESNASRSGRNSVYAVRLVRGG